MPLHVWPFAFRDGALEAKYQEYFIQNLIEETRSMLTAVMCFIWITRIMFILVRVVFPYPWTVQEAIVLSSRIAALFITTTSLSFDWSRRARKSIAYLLIWMCRMMVFAAYAEQSGVNQIDSMVLPAPIMFTVIIGLIIPSFEEFCFITISIFSVKPVMIILYGRGLCPSGVSSPCPGRDLQTVVIQNMSLVCTAIGVYYHVHSDRRRNWILSFEMFGSLNDVEGNSNDRHLSAYMDSNGDGALYPEDNMHECKEHTNSQMQRHCLPHIPSSIIVSSAANLFCTLQFPMHFDA